MYYEEKIFKDVLFYRDTPDGNWRKDLTAKGEAIKNLMSLSDEERLEVFNYFCTYCGDQDPHCQCMNEE